MDVPYFFIIIILVLLVYYSFVFNKYPPGPIALPYLGNILIVKKFSRKYGGLSNAFRELCKRYNTDLLSITIAGNYTVVVQSKALIDEVLNGNKYLGRPNNFFIRLRTMGVRKGITMTDGPLWKEQRAFALKHLHELGLGKNRMEYMIQTQCKEMLDDLENCNLSNVVLRQYIAKSVLNVLWELVTGSPFRNSKTMNYLMSLMEARSKAFDMSGGLLSQFPWIRYFFPNYSGYNLIQSLNNKFKEMITEIIDNHKRTYKTDQTRDFIDAFLHQMYKNTSSHTTFTDEQLIMVCLDFFIGGAQTTSSTLDFCFLYMTMHQDIQAKVQEELDRVLLPGQVPSKDDKEKFPYVQAVLLEVQRQVPVTPIIGPRRTTSDTFLGSYFIPKDTTLFLYIPSIHENDKIWEEPAVFKPERFLNKEGKVMQDKKLYNFGKGKRRCPAESLAKTSLFILFSTVLHNYKLLAVNEKRTLSLQKISGITLSPADYSINLIKRFKCGNSN